MKHRQYDSVLTLAGISPSFTHERDEIALCTAAARLGHVAHHCTCRIVYFERSRRIVFDSSRSALRLVHAGRIAALSLRRASERRSNRATSSARSKRFCARPDCRTSGSTTFAIVPRACSLPKACRCARLWSYSATPASVRPRISIAMLPAMMRDVAGKMETVLSGPVNQARQEVGVKIVRFEPDGCQNGCQNESDTYLERQKALILLARPEGFEPPTHRSVVCRSNPRS